MAMKQRSRVATAPVHASLPASDLVRAERFYGDTLGLDIERDKTGSGFMARSGEGCWMYVYQTEARAGSATQAVFTVRDVESVVSDLREHGVRFEEYDLPGLRTVDGIAEADGIKSAWFKDSEGNTIAVSEDMRSS